MEILLIYNFNVFKIRCNDLFRHSIPQMSPVKRSAVTNKTDLDIFLILKVVP
ncbi:hypothetical protein D3C84_1229780 [compost metagenome]